MYFRDHMARVDAGDSGKYAGLDEQGREGDQAARIHRVLRRWGDALSLPGMVSPWADRDRACGFPAQGNVISLSTG